MTTRSLVLWMALSIPFAAGLALASPAPRAWTPPSTVVLTESDGDPDVPAFMRGRIDKTEYLARRDRRLALKLGGDVGLATRARVAAINAMQRQQRDLGPFGVAGSWSPLGPSPIPNGQSNPAGAPVSGRVTCIEVHPLHPDTAYAGTAQGGVYRTYDGGAHWTAIFDAAQSLAIGALALAPSDPSILYVGTGESSSSCDSYFGVGLYRIDGVDSTPVLHGPFDPAVATGLAGTTAFTGRAISHILVNPTNADTVFVATASGIGGIGCDPLSGFAPPLALRGLYRTANGTSTSPGFSKLTVTSAGSVAPDVTGNRSVMDMTFLPGDASVLLCYVRGLVGDGGVYRSSDIQSASPTFTRTLAVTDVNGRGVFSAVATASGSKLLVATSELATGTSCTTGSGVLRRSDDGGVTWTGKLPGGGGFCGGQCWYDIVVAIDPSDTNIVHIGGSAGGTCSREYARSVDGGSSFGLTNWDGADVHADCHAIVVAPSNPAIVYMGNDGGVYRSDDRGYSWASRNTAGFSATQFQSLAVHPTDANFTIGGTQDNGTNWYGPAGSWLRADWGDGGFSAIDQSSPDTANVLCYHTYYNGTNNLIGVARATSTSCMVDGGWAFRGAGYLDPTPGCDGSAVAANNGIALADTVLFYAPIALGPGTPNTLYFATDRLYRSGNRGDTMVPVSQDVVPGGAISAIGIAAMNDDVRIVGTEYGKVYATTSGSSLLSDVTHASMPSGTYVARAVIDPADPNTAYVAFAGFGVASGRHIWRTRNLAGGSTSWEVAGTGLPDTPVNALVVDSLSHNRLFAGTDIGVYASSDYGDSWAPLGTGLPVVAVYDMAIQPRARALRIATHGRGLWQYTLDNTTAALASLMGARVEGGRVYLQWHVAGDATTRVTLARRYRPGEWQDLATLSLDGSGNLAFEDADVIAGGKYEYALRVEGRVIGNVTVDIVEDARLDLAGAFPNPSSQGMVLRFTLANATAATLDLLDLSGRRVLVREVGPLGAGQHEPRPAGAAPCARCLLGAAAAVGTSRLTPRDRVPLTAAAAPPRIVPAPRRNSPGARGVDSPAARHLPCAPCPPRPSRSIRCRPYWSGSRAVASWCWATSCWITTCGGAASASRRKRPCRSWTCSGRAVPLAAPATWPPTSRRSAPSPCSWA